jgi:outer membrane protein assembly factor BamD (BamD/ComL family)
MKASLTLSFLISFLLICSPQSHVDAQDFLKKFLSNSSIKRGKQFKSDGDYPSAITAFTKSIKRKPENLEAYYQLGLIIEKVLRDYDKAISLYKSVITLSEGVNPVGTDEELKAFNSLITNTKESLDRAIGQKFKSIEKPKVPVYIMIKPNKTIRKEPKMLSYSLHKTTSYVSEFRLLDFKYNWYQINVPSIGHGWINGKNVLKITQKEKKAIETSPPGKAALYQRFVDQYPDSHFASEAKARADSISYEIATEEGTINSYTTYLRKYPNSKYSDEVQLKKDELTFKDEGFLNDINRLKHWIASNPESTFIEKAKERFEELTFAQAKNDNNTVSLEGYIIDFPDGRFVSEAKQLIEDIKYNHAISIDTVISYKKYLDEYPDGKYAHDAAKRIDEKEFSDLLNSRNIELLVEHLINEANEKRTGLVKNRIEELYFTKADKIDNDVEAIKMHEEYLRKYPDGQYAREAEVKIEGLSFDIATRTDTKEGYRNFLKEYPQSKHYKEAIDAIEVLDFNVALTEHTPESFGNFLVTYPDGEFASEARNRIEEIAFKKAKDLDTIEAYEGFVKSYPNSMLVNDATKILEAKYFEAASQIGTVKAYKKHIELYPDGSHLEEARLIIDMLTYKPYDEKGSVRSLKKFIRKYPENRYVNEARQKITLLQTSNDEKVSDSGFPYLLTIIIFFGVGIAIAGVLMRKRGVSIVRSTQQGDWNCECGTKHNRDVENCSVCKNTRPKFDEASLIDYAIWLREKLYAMYGKLPEKEVIAQKTKDIQAKTINTFGKVKEYHDKLEKEREEKYQKVEEEPVPSESYTKAEFKNKQVEDKTKIYSKPTFTKGPTIISYFMAFLFPFFYFFSRKRTTAGIVSLVICLVSIPFMFFVVGVISYFAMIFWAMWNLRYELMYEHVTLQAEVMARKLAEIKEKDN